MIIIKLNSIPSNFLTDNTYYYQRRDTESETEFESPILIKKVKIQKKIDKEQDYSMEILIFNFIIYVDFKFSFPFIIPNINDKFEILNGNKKTEMRVRGVEINSAFNRIHHVKVVCR